MPDTKVEEEAVKETEESEVSQKKSFKKKLEKKDEEIARLKADVEHWKNEYYRAYADTKNLRSNLEKEHHEAMKYRSEGFVEELFPILDSFYVVLKKEPEDPNLKNYLIGFNYIYKNLISVLENEGVHEIAPNEGDLFDANTMNAVDSVEIENDDEINKIVQVYSKGYKLHDRLIRPASVKVNVKKEVKEEVKEDKKEDKLDA